MPRTITLHPLSLALGAAVLGGAFLLASQTLPPAQVVWPPPKALMLNVFEEFAPAVTIPGSGSYTVLTVPNDRWLTVTGASAFASTGAYWTPDAQWVEVPQVGAIKVKGAVVGGWPSDASAGNSPKLGAPETTPAGCGGPIGWTFAPGSSVALRNRTATGQTLAGYSLIGYYSRN